MGQFKALIIKNLILYRRNWFGSFCEIFIPIFFGLCLFVIRMMFPVEIIPETTYAGNFNYTQQYVPYFTLKQMGQLGQKLIKNCKTNQVYNKTQRNGIVVIGPSGDQLAESLNFMLTDLGYQIEMVNNNSDINQRAMSQDYGKTTENPYMCFSIFVDSSEQNYSFRLRYNSSDMWSLQGPFSLSRVFSPLPFNPYPALLAGRLSGLFEINTMILNNIALKQLNQLVLLNPILSPMGNKQYIQDQLYRTIQNFVDIFTVFPIVIIFLRMTSNMLRQKQKRIRQIMTVMGMSSISYYSSWIIKYLLVYIATHAVTTLIFVYTLDYTNYLIILCSFILFDIVLIMQSLVIQIFFMQAVLGTLVALTMFFIQYIGGFIIKSLSTPSQIQIILASICPFSAVVMIFQDVFYSTASSQTLDWSKFSSRVFNYRTSIGFISLFVNIIVWLLVVIYLDQIYPNQEGIRKHPLFCFGKKFKSVIIEEQKCNVISQQKQYIKTIKQQGIIFNQVWKVYSHNNKIAVNNLNFCIQPNTIFTLLGHNGAGKTTTLSMLAGITQITKGEIIIKNKSIQNHMKQLKQIMGFCPQHNTLYDELTCIQHLKLFLTFKGKQCNQNTQLQLNNLLKDLDLSEKKNDFTVNLSGGQKRRLQLALSFVGGAKIIFLDQPTSGLDPYSRRRVWNFIQKNKQGKIIILTTHFMDQAEILSDSIGIMKDGTLIEYGSPKQLKQKYNLGYKLNIQKRNPLISSQPILAQIKKVFTDIEVFSTIPAELTMRLLVNNETKFKQLFQILDFQKQKLGIVGYRLNTSTLQEMVIKISQNKLHNKKNLQQIKQNVQFNDEINNVTYTNFCSINSELDQAISQINCQSTNIRNLPRLSDSKLLFKNIWTITQKRVKLTFRNLKLLLLQLIIPSILVLIIMIIQKSLGANQIITHSMNYQLYDGYLPLSYIIAETNQNNNSTLKNLSKQLLQNNQGLINLDLINSIQQNSTIFDSQILRAYHTKQTLAGILIQNTSNLNYTYSVIANTQSEFAPLVALNKVTQSIINMLSSNNISINMIYDPFPLTYNQKLIYYNQSVAFFIAIIFSIALAYKYGSVISQIVKQRTTSCKHLQIISGMRLNSFWIGNFIFDYTSYLLFMVFSLGMCKAFSIYQLASEGPFEATVILFLLYGIAQQLFTYVCSFLFKQHSNAQTLFYFFNFMAGAMIPSLILIFRNIGGIMLKVAFGLSWILRIFPSYAFGQALINLQSISVLTWLQKVNYKPMDGKIALYDIIYLALQIPLYFIILMVIEIVNWGSLRRQFVQSKQNKNKTTQLNLKSPINSQIQYHNNDLVVLKNIEKIYKKNGKKAINGLNMAVEAGQVFGLLGVNGAGKSSTFKILTRDQTATSGETFINTLNIQTQFSEAKKYIGYCPQFSALFETLTVKEQLQFYYKIKGYDQTFLSKQVLKIMKMLDIQKYKNVYSVDLSGGNKRKLSIGIALICNPKVILLDEPSTGMDPYSKRFMWKMISDLSQSIQKVAVIFTTHSMQQAQLLSTRVGIMVNGNFKCSGTPSFLKNKYADCFFLQIKIKQMSEINIFKQKYNLNNNELQMQVSNDTITEIITKYLNMQDLNRLQIIKLQKHLPCTLQDLFKRIYYQQKGFIIKQFISKNITPDFIEEHDNKNWKFRINSPQSIGKTITLIERQKQQLNITQYYVNSVSLEQILNRFSEQNHKQQELKID